MALDLKLKPRDSRILAVGLLLILVGLFYLLFVHWWFLSPYLDYADQMSDLRDRQLRLRRIAAERPDIEKHLADVRAYEQGNQAFLAENDVTAASAALIQRLKQAVANHVPDPKRCQLVSQQSYSGGEEELYKRVTTQVRMRCDLESFATVVYDLENSKPYLFIDQLMIYKQQVYVPPGGKPVVSPLDIRFNLSGYLRQPGKVAAP